MGILLWDIVKVKAGMIKTDIKCKISEIDSDSVSESINRIADFANKQNEKNMSSFREYLKNLPDDVILHNMNNSGTEEGKLLCRDEAKRRVLI